MRPGLGNFWKTAALILSSPIRRGCARRISTRRTPMCFARAMHASVASSGRAPDRRGFGRPLAPRWPSARSFWSARWSCFARAVAFAGWCRQNSFAPCTAPRCAPSLPSIPLSRWKTSLTARGASSMRRFTRRCSIFKSASITQALGINRVWIQRARASRRAPSRPGTSTKLTVWRGDSATSWRSETPALFAACGQPGAPWLLAEPRALRLFERMRAVSETLGEVPALQPSRGLFTGCNDVFIHDDAATRALLGNDFDAFSRPVLSGRDVRPWSVKTPQRILWPYEAALELRNDLPDALQAHFSTHATRLKGRSDFRSDSPLYQMFRVKTDRLKPKVVWRDLSPKLEAALAPAEVVALNTVYFIALEDMRRARLFAALLNSAPMRAMAYALAERARGGWRRHFAWVMRLLPVPRRIVEFIDGKDDLQLLAFEQELRDDTTSAHATARLDLLAGELFGLEPDDVDYLRAWRCPEEVA